VCFVVLHSLQDHLRTETCDLDHLISYWCKNTDSQGKGVKQVMKVFLSCVRKMVCPREDNALFARSSSSGSRQSQLLRHVEPEGSSQQRRPM
jgi:hypothetical protein